jgi:hypothetical protein
MADLDSLADCLVESLFGFSIAWPALRFLVDGRFPPRRLDSVSGAAIPFPPPSAPIAAKFLISIRFNPPWSRQIPDSLRRK